MEDQTFILDAEKRSGRNLRGTELKRLDLIFEWTVHKTDVTGSSALPGTNNRSLEDDLGKINEELAQPVNVKLVKELALMTMVLSNMSELSSGSSGYFGHASRITYGRRRSYALSLDLKKART